MATHPQRRQLTGIIVSDKMTKTVVVRVERTVTHPMYKKQFTVSRRFTAHSATGEFHTGDKVVIEETRPLSATKRWRVIRKA
jgi:small subunit ribosomal protein S17